MKFTLGLIFLLINVSISFSLREVDFMNRLYPGQDIPKPIFTALVNRRITQVNSLYSDPKITDNPAKTFTDDAKTFYKSTNQSLQLIIDLLDSDDMMYSRNGTVSFYTETVGLLNAVNKQLTELTGNNIDDHSVNSAYHISCSHNHLQELVDAYIDDIKLVIDYQKSIGNEARVNMNIVNHLKLLSEDVKTNTIHADPPSTVPFMTRPQATARKSVDQSVRRLDFLLDKFIFLSINYRAQF